MLVIIIGLPGSGKTTYFNNNKENLFKNYIYHDDFISNFFNGELMNDIKENKNVCISDPRLCNIEKFNNYLKVFLEFKDKKEIKLILFENNKNKCLENAKHRNKKNVNKTIELLSNIYNLDNYNSFHFEIIPI